MCVVLKGQAVSSCSSFPYSQVIRVLLDLYIQTRHVPSPYLVLGFLHAVDRLLILSAFLFVLVASPVILDTLRVPYQTCFCPKLERRAYAWSSSYLHLDLLPAMATGFSRSILSTRRCVNHKASHFQRLSQGLPERSLSTEATQHLVRNGISPGVLAFLYATLVLEHRAPLQSTLRITPTARTRSKYLPDSVSVLLLVATCALTQ